MKLALVLSLFVSLGPTRVLAYTVGSFVSSVHDASRDRTIDYTLYYPESFVGTASVLIFSHGGTGSALGHTRYRHFGTRWAQSGYVAIHVNHLPTSPAVLHQVDRPRDVSFVLDRIQAGSLPLPAAFTGSLDVGAFGHAGHSFGAYTSMALAGGHFFPFASFRDPRIVAVAPVSPQGPDQFGAFDNGPSDNTWADIETPAFDLVGGDEKDTNAIGTIFVVDWRLTPFLRYPGIDDKFQAILPGQDHAEMGDGATPETQEYLGENTRLFFDVYLRGDTSGVCGIGTSPAFAGQTLSAKSDPQTGLASACPPPIGVPEPGGAAGLIAAIPVLAWLARRRPGRAARERRIPRIELPSERRCPLDLRSTPQPGHSGTPPRKDDSDAVPRTDRARLPRPRHCPRRRMRGIEGADARGSGRGARSRIGRPGACDRPAAVCRSCDSVQPACFSHGTGRASAGVLSWLGGFVEWPA